MKALVSIFCYEFTRNVARHRFVDIEGFMYIVYINWEYLSPYWPIP